MDTIAISKAVSRNETALQESLPQPSLSYLAVALSFVILSTLTAFSHLIHKDYLRFKALGPGGTPSTWLGYLRIKFLGLFALSNPYMPPPIPPEIYLNRSAYLSKSELPRRQGRRPLVSGIAPHRQLDQRPSSEVFESLRAKIDEMGDHWPRKLRKGTSCLEKFGPGLFAQNPINKSRHCSGEIVHAHPSDGSMHLTLHPADAAVVVLRGWGERHPLSSGGWLKRFVPMGFVMIYAPRTQEEVEIVRRIVGAAVWWVGGVDVEEKFGEGMGDILEELEEGEEGQWVDPGCSMPKVVREAVN